jgi:hypothetical protein
MKASTLPFETTSTGGWNPLHDTGITGGSRPTDRVVIVHRYGRVVTKLRLTVHLDPYDFQAYTLAERWDGDRWQQVVRWSGTERALPSPYAQQPQVTAGIDAALDAVLAVAEQIA